MGEVNPIKAVRDRQAVADGSAVVEAASEHMRLHTALDTLLQAHAELGHSGTCRREVGTRTVDELITEAEGQTRKLRIEEQRRLARNKQGSKKISGRAHK